MPRPHKTPEQRAFGAAVGALVREERARLSLSGDQLARASNVSVDLIRSIENGRVASPGLFSVASIAAALGVAVDDLVPEVSR
ncbi:helix-turn-helix transcriptional regulator [uncultured Microbacterium sp.]|uniref:helix-turn-helix domain-containing protein n=1 Tax=unclassified Microbacterium TaxID=2609290 RepID=UPI003455AAAD|tara:strand:- start:1322 stop:1570 length:249 start_codon:yes stop_codon:yes gene_type:complete